MRLVTPFKIQLIYCKYISEIMNFYNTLEHKKKQEIYLYINIGVHFLELDYLEPMKDHQTNLVSS